MSYEPLNTLAVEVSGGGRLAADTDAGVGSGFHAFARVVRAVRVDVTYLEPVEVARVTTALSEFTYQRAIR
jgi:hypothetical protein